MRGWYDLPPELRREIVKELNLIDRVSLRECSDSDREIVDSVRIFLPRVIFNHRETRLLLKIYEGIDDFWQYEFVADGNGSTTVFSYKSNGYETSLSHAPTDLVSCVMAKMERFLMVPNVRIGTLEWHPAGCFARPEQLNDSEKMHCSKLFNRHGFLGLNEFLVVENNEDLVECMTGIPDVYEEKEEDFVPKLAMFDVYLGADCERVYKIEPITTEGAIRFLANFEHTIKSFSVDLSDEALSYEEMMPMHMICMVNSEEVNAKKLFNVLPEPTERLNEQVLTKKRYLSNGTTYLQFNLSSCGLWFFPVTTANQSLIPEKIMTGPCGLGSVCPKCSDPFDHWYTRSFVNRLQNDPFWEDVQQEETAEQN